MRKAVLFLNGEKPQKLPSVEKYTAIYCTDGAFDFLQIHGIVPDCISGDFDSISTLPDGIKVLHTPDQNFTDFDKALSIICSHGFKTVDVYAASGREQDHFLGNLCTAVKYKDQLSIRFFDDHQRYHFIDHNTQLHDINNHMVSLFPFSEATGVTTTGLQYPLKNARLSINTHRISTRNHAIADTIKIEFTSGNLLIFIANQPDKA